MMLAWKTAACLAAGNTVVLKPAQVGSTFYTPDPERRKPWRCFRLSHPLDSRSLRLQRSSLLNWQQERDCPKGWLTFCLVQVHSRISDLFHSRRKDGDAFWNFRLPFRRSGGPAFVWPSWRTKAGLHGFYRNWQAHHEEVRSRPHTTLWNLKPRNKHNCSHRVCALCFTPSCAVSNVKKVSLELGGKSPLIIFGDCDMDKAVRLVGPFRGLFISLCLCLRLAALTPGCCLRYRAWAPCSSTKERTASQLAGCLWRRPSMTSFWKKWYVSPRTGYYLSQASMETHSRHPQRPE